MNTNIKTKLRISVAISLVICICVSLIGFEANCEDLRNNILRLHILANSDSDADQALKLKVRDEIINRSEINFEACTNLEEALKKTEQLLPEIEKIAQKTIYDNGFSYSVTAEIGKEYFKTRIYDEFTLPAGYYDSLIIKIGEANGKNWWCVIFPSMCVPAACDDLENYVGEGAANISENRNKYQVRFKIVEYYQNFKKILSK